LSSYNSPEQRLASRSKSKSKRKGVVSDEDGGDSDENGECGVEQKCGRGDESDKQGGRGEEENGLESGARHLYVCFRRSGNVWRVDHERLSLPSVNVTPMKTKGVDRCVYTLGNMTRAFCRFATLDKSDGLSPGIVKNMVMGFVREDTCKRPGQWAARIQAKGLEQMFGQPHVNMCKLPALLQSLAGDGHAIEATYQDGLSMVQLLHSVVMDDWNRRYRDVLELKHKRGRDISAAELLKYPAEPWGEAEAAAWQAKHKEVLDAASAPELRYLKSSLAYAPAPTNANHGELLRFVGVDAAHMSKGGEAFTLFSCLGLTFNKEAITFCYYWESSNESTASWTNCLGFLKRNYHSLISNEPLR
jgi:hypothetical protein